MTTDDGIVKYVELISFIHLFPCHMTIDLNRTFSEITSATSETEEFDWSNFAGLGTLTWDKLHGKRIVVVLGEAGIGKTTEFKMESQRLSLSGKSAFFIPLNQISGAEGWQLALTAVQIEYERWLNSEDQAYFFLDAVDESRLKSPSDFQKALAVISHQLMAKFHKINFVLSSRITDWSIPEVQNAVDTYLVKPISAASANQPDSGSLEQHVGEVKVFTVGLDSLSVVEAQRYACELKLLNPDRFWQAIDEGGYHFMATRPLDLKWMVSLWNQSRALGSYTQLIETNIAQRLNEHNENYVASDIYLSHDELLIGTIELAAAAEFGGCAFFSIEPKLICGPGEIDPSKALNWSTLKIRRLLCSAVFDEASYGRVQFHHRSIREFLAAKWIERQLSMGVPWHRLESLFVGGSQFGQSILIPARKATLSWLAAINVKVREWVVQQFPELLFFQGDPTSWDRISVDEAFFNLQKKSREQHHFIRFQSVNECIRVGLAISPGKVAMTLADSKTSRQTRILCLQIAQFAKLNDCSSAVFDIYRNVAYSESERILALDALEVIGTPEQRFSILTDLKCATTISNELIASSLSVTPWESLSAKELSTIFDRTRNEQDLGSGPMAKLLRNDLVPRVDFSSAQMLLQAVMKSLPRPLKGKRFNRFPESEHPERLWLLNALPVCFERLLELIPSNTQSYPSICMEAAERIESQRDLWLINRNELKRVQNAIAAHKYLRWEIALAVAKSEHISQSFIRLTWEERCVVSFCAADLPELIKRATDSRFSSEESDIWFFISAEIIFSIKNGEYRANLFRQLNIGNASSARRDQISHRYKNHRQKATQYREHMSLELKEFSERDQRLEKDISYYRSVIENVRTGKEPNSLTQLFSYCLLHFGYNEFAGIDFSEIANKLGKDIADALDQGLSEFWPSVSAPDAVELEPQDWQWPEKMAQAGIRRYFFTRKSFSALTEEQAATATKVAIWDPSSPSNWFISLSHSHLEIVVSTLIPYITAEIQTDISIYRDRGALRMILRCPSEIRTRLLSPLIPLVISDQIPFTATAKEIVAALGEDHELSKIAIGEVCRKKLSDSCSDKYLEIDMDWLRIWMDRDSLAAWNWYSQYLQEFPDRYLNKVIRFVEKIGDMQWVNFSAGTEDVDTLVGIHDLLSAQLHTKAEKLSPTLPNAAIENFRDRIPHLFVKVAGQLGHNALNRLACNMIDDVEKLALQDRVKEHAEFSISFSANKCPEELAAIGSPFSFAPTSEAQLFEQVIARLEQIRKDLEEGPFSERDLFKAKMPEKHLQRWLAAKFRDTQNIRFSVHREEEVDNDKMTDIQLSADRYNVCIEIKPVDSGRYSAKQLTETLQNQIVEQYLKGHNSSRGILVLLQLDRKKWEIPGERKRQSFESLVRYLEEQAHKIKLSTPHVEELTVFGICCLGACKNNCVSSPGTIGER
ncbi:MAG: hypothetical protein WA071_05425 [Undibacterium umbellatum]|uniref:hypothetical protein n=1 Tax=Undibacterium umbellatum TaxID=2762300 RepID=UPI003BB645A7